MDKKEITKKILSEKGMLDVSKYTQQDNAFYSSGKWLRESKRYKELHPFCEVCLKDKIKTPSEIIHHITPISQGGACYDENNLLAVCKKCHGEIHIGIVIRIDLEFIRNLIQKEPTPEDEWWTYSYDLYRDKHKKIIDTMNKAEALEKNEMEISIELYFNVCKLIDDFEEILADDLLIEKAYCQRYGVISFRTVRYPINRLSLLLEKSKRYSDCIQLISDYQKKTDKCGLTRSDLEAIQKRKDRVSKKVQ